MSRRTRRRAMVLALMCMVGIALFLLGGFSAAGDPPEGLALATLEEERLPDMGLLMEAPEPVAASGWPFQQLPLVAKFEVPAPRVVAVRPPPFRRVTGPQSTPARDIPDVPVDELSPWLLAPLAAAAFVGGSDGVAPPASTVPEPATLLLLSTGLLIIGVRARYRRRYHTA